MYNELRPFKLHDWMSFGIGTYPWACHYNQDDGRFCHPKLSCCPFLLVFSLSLSFPGNHSHCRWVSFIAGDFKFYGISYKWKHTIRTFFFFSIEQNYFEMYPRVSSFFLFIAYIYVCLPHCPVDRHFAPVLAIVSEAAENIHAHVSEWTSTFISLGKYLGVRLLGHMSICLTF